MTDLHVSGAAASVASQLEGRAPAGRSSAQPTRRTGSCATPCGRKLLTTPGGSTRSSRTRPAYARRLDAFHSSVAQEELQRLLDGVHERARVIGHCRVVTIVGEAGIGKTRLAPRVRRGGARRSTGARRALCLVRRGRDLPADRGDRRAGSGESHHCDGIRALLEGEEDADVGRPTSRGTHRGRGISSRSGRGLLGRAPAARVDSRAQGRSSSHSTTSTGQSRRCSTSWSTSASGRRARSSSLCLARGDLLEARPGWGGPTSTGFLVRLEPLSEETLGALVRATGRRARSTRKCRSGSSSTPGGNPSLRRAAARSREGSAGGGARPGHRQPWKRCSPAVSTASIPDELRSPSPSCCDRPSLSRARSSTTFRADGRHRPTAREPDRTRTGASRAGSSSASIMCWCATSRIAASRNPNAPSYTSSRARGLDRRDGADELVGYHFEQAYGYLTQLAKPDDHALRARERRRRATRQGRHPSLEASGRACSREPALSCGRIGARARTSSPASSAPHYASVTTWTRAEEVLLKAVRVAGATACSPGADRACPLCAPSRSRTAPDALLEVARTRFRCWKLRVTIEDSGARGSASGR